MEIFHSFQEITGFTGAVVALGTFDGVHRGHQMVMKTAIKRAAACGVKTMVVTFTAHPLSVLCPDKEPLRLATIGQKAEYIEAVGIDGLVLLPMSEHLLQESPEEFCKNLLTYIHPSAIVVGSNFTYGAKAAGNTETMKFFMSQYDIPCWNGRAGRRLSAAPSSAGSSRWGTWKRQRTSWAGLSP